MKSKKDRTEVRPLSRQKILGASSSSSQLLSPPTSAKKNRIQAYAVFKPGSSGFGERPGTAPVGVMGRQRPSTISSRGGAFLTGLLDDDVSVMTDTPDLDDRTVSELSSSGFTVTHSEASKCVSLS
jgi:hypothetical protein